MNGVGRRAVMTMLTADAEGGSPPPNRESLDLIRWPLERDGPLHKGGGFHHRSIKKAIGRDGDTLTVLDVLAKQVGIRGMFPDWPATTTFYASCVGMK